MHPLPDRLTMLRAVWPWREPPILDFMRRQLADRGRVDLDDREQRLVLRLPDMSAPVHVRIERTDPPVRDVHPDMLSASTLERRRLARSRWHVVLEHELDPRDPTRAFHVLMQLAVLLSPDLPALYDPAALALRPGAVARRMAARRVPPPPPALYRLHAVLPDGGSGTAKPEAGAWVHTHGLMRIGLPELELHQVPVALLDEAFELVAAIVTRGIEDAGLLEGPPIEVVRGHPLASRRLEALGPDCVPALRSPERGVWHGGTRRVIVSVERGVGAPVACLEAIGEGAVMRGTGEREAARMSDRAREGWPEFGMSFVRHREDEAYRFMVRLAYRVDRGAPDEREHLWFEVLEIAPGRVRARLLDEPVAILRMRAGDVDWHELDAMSDWTVHQPDGALRPHDL